ncbi:hypothetical protein [Actinomadura rubrobrunea]|uniref:hypothetical protein n=1 Tax=Actinomadura rubrobrunea TaxID=115335 RepID=UPI000A912957|nr:hypothetical protein [Actinomadura rubrobrunea]
MIKQTVLLVKETWPEGVLRRSGVILTTVPNETVRAPPDTRDGSVLYGIRM